MRLPVLVGACGCNFGPTHRQFCGEAARLKAVMAVAFAQQKKDEFSVAARALIEHMKAQGFNPRLLEAYGAWDP